MHMQNMHKICIYMNKYIKYIQVIYENIHKIFKYEQYIYPWQFSVGSSPNHVHTCIYMQK